MKAILLAAGKGERLKPITDKIPKPMIRIEGKPILEHNINLLKKYDINEIFINLHHLPEVIKDYFGNGNRWDVNITYSYESKLLGTAGVLRNFQKYLSNSKFLVIYGDNLMEFDLNKFLSFHIQKKGIGTIVLYKRIDVSQSGIALLDGNKKIIKFIEKPTNNQIFSSLVSAGVFILEPEILKYIPDNKYSDFGYDIFPELIKERKSLYGFEIEGKIIAIDTIELYESLTRV